MHAKSYWQHRHPTIIPTRTMKSGGVSGVSGLIDLEREVGGRAASQTTLWITTSQENMSWLYKVVGLNSFVHHSWKAVSTAQHLDTSHHSVQLEWVERAPKTVSEVDSRQVRLQLVKSYPLLQHMLPFQLKFIRLALNIFFSAFTPQPSSWPCCALLPSS